jgi:hypothetical protein
LLHRIIEEYGQTAAARKARERLGIPEPIVVTAEEPVVEEAAEEPPAPAELPAKPETNLPPGFRPKA